MLYYLFQWLDKYDFPGAGMFGYTSFRSLMAIILALLISSIWGDKFINLLKCKQITETQRDASIDPFGVNKVGVPSMGGVIIIFAILIPCLLLGKLSNIYMILMLITTIWLGSLGFADDYIKIFKKDKEGLHGSPKGYTAIVDYAHTPDALVNVLNAIHGVLEGKGKVITVVGAGGNRDKGKRPIMAKESARLSDRVIITSDNPRFEEPQDIINDMLAGLDKDDMQKTISITDRREAIKTACMLAQPGDVILVAGKGHENYQEIKGVKHHFDDKE